VFAVSLGAPAPPPAAAVQSQTPSRQPALAGRVAARDLPEADEDLSVLTPRVRKPRAARGERARLIFMLSVAFLLLAGIGAGVAFLMTNLGKPAKENVQKDGEADDGTKEKDDDPPKKTPEKPTGKTPASVDPELVSLSREKQEKVNKAIDQAIVFLKKQQQHDGQWQLSRAIRAVGAHHVGLTALPAVTLLECGVPANDEVVQRAVKYVRGHCAGLTLTYDISLAILLLDRLNDPEDKELIQILALRLVAGQTPNGGWSYNCPVYAKKERDLLVTALKAVPLPRNKLELVETPKEPDRHNKLTLEDAPNVTTDRPDGTKLMLEAPDKPSPKLQLELDKLPPKLKKLPVLQVQDGPAEEFTPKRSDNSNTQFAILGLWAARRHDVPLDRTLGLIVKRFRTSQFLSGGWSYGYVYTVGMDKKFALKFSGIPTMTCAGLLGLAVGHGLANDIKSADAGRDSAVNKALKALAVALRSRQSWTDPGQRRYNMYLLWSVERVAVIYGLKRIGLVDWYNWGADILLAHQSQEDGSWFSEGYHGADPITDTSLALLFLKRVNLARDLNTKLTLSD
jgi:hypothetical protein